MASAVCRRHAWQNERNNRAPHPYRGGAAFVVPGGRSSASSGQYSSWLLYSRRRWTCCFLINPFDHSPTSGLFWKQSFTTQSGLFSPSSDCSCSLDSSGLVVVNAPPRRREPCPGYLRHLLRKQNGQK